MIKMIKILLRLLAVPLSGVIVAVFGFIAGAMVFAIFGFKFSGRQGYEAGGPIDFILGALIRLIGSSLRLFRRRTEK